MKQYNCPDCTHIEDTCENCKRYQSNEKTNFTEYYIQWPYQQTTTFETITYPSIPPACRDCPNHPSNGGSGFCACTLGLQDIYCS